MSQDTSNQFEVGVRAEGNCIVIMQLRTTVLSRAEALNLAAWLRVLADPGGDEFQKIVEAIQSS